jgi:hypothetical protein
LYILTTFKNFPYKATSIVGMAYLLNWFIAGLHPNTWEIIFVPLFLYLAISALRNFIIIAANWTSPYSAQCVRSFQLFLLCFIFLGLTVPVIRLGHYLKIQIFLTELPRYQQLVDGIIEREKTRAPGEGAMIPVPIAYADLCPYWIIFESEENHTITVDFMTDDYGFPPRHGGYIYISNADPFSLKEIRYRDYHFVRLAPNWYRWSD